jgi:hypothetical protein
VFDGPDEVIERAARELRRPVATNPARKARIMELVRAVGPHAGPPAASGRSRRGGVRGSWSSPTAGLLLAAGVAGVAALGTVQARSGAAAASPAGANVAAAIRDTLRLVRFIFVAPGASRVAVAGDFNRWSPRATPLVAAESGGVWAVTVALAPGRHRYAFVVDDTQWVREPGGSRAGMVLDVPIE